MRNPISRLYHGLVDTIRSWRYGDSGKAIDPSARIRLDDDYQHRMPFGDVFGDVNATSIELVADSIAKESRGQVNADIAASVLALVVRYSGARLSGLSDEAIARRAWGSVYDFCTNVAQGHDMPYLKRLVEQTLAPALSRDERLQRLYTNPNTAHAEGAIIKTYADILALTKHVDRKMDLDGVVGDTGTFASMGAELHHQRPGDVLGTVAVLERLDGKQLKQAAAVHRARVAGNGPTTRPKEIELPPDPGVPPIMGNDYEPRSSDICGGPGSDLEVGVLLENPAPAQPNNGDETGATSKTFRPLEVDNSGNAAPQAGVVIRAIGRLRR